MTMPVFDREKSYYLQRLIRRTEEVIAEIYASDKVKSPVHLSIGQEAIAAGVCMALAPQDIIFSNYRGHAHYIAKGGDLKKMWAELYGKANGHAGGKAGSMHLADLSANFMPASAIVASAISNAVGYALALKQRGSTARVVCFHGDGATEEGVFWESMNFAALQKVPVLFICENNDYAIYSRQSARQAGSSIAEKAEAFGVKSLSANGLSSEAVYSLMAKAFELQTHAGGPVLVELSTYRWLDHVGPDDDHTLGYRPTTELLEAQKLDDLANLSQTIGQNRTDELDVQAEKALQAALDYAEGGSFPPAKALMEHTYAD